MTGSRAGTSRGFPVFSGASFPEPEAGIGSTRFGLRGEARAILRNKDRERIA